METCRNCSGSGQCYYCDGTGSMKESNPHPDPWDVDDDGEVECTECRGSGNCQACGGDGETDDD